MIVIGGDDNYKNEDEEDKEFISRWARRKISPQFGEEFLNGSKSFVFSWDKKHREIHEKALLHFFDPTMKGQKFEYHRLQRRAVTRETQIPSREKGPEFSNRYIGRPGIQSQGARPRGTTSFTKQPQETNGG